MNRCYFLLIMPLFLLSCNQGVKKQNEQKKEEVAKVQEAEIIDSKKQFLIENELKEDADLSDAQIEEIKGWIDSGTFDKISICQAFYDLLPLNDSEGRKYLKQFKLPKGKDIDDLSVFLNFTARRACFKKPVPRTPKTKEEIEALFSDWDGSLPDLIDKTKEQLKNPSSFKHIETSFKDVKSKLIVKMKYSATNSFNATIVEEITATVDYSGKVIKMYKIN